MINCTVVINAVTQTLDAGHRTVGGDTSDQLYAGPAYVSAPSGTLDRTLAAQGVIDATLLVHNAVDLFDAARVTIASNRMAGAYDVQAVGVTGNEWRINLKRRDTR